jgi:hypothetical protein
MGIDLTGNDMPVMHSRPGISAEPIQSYPSRETYAFLPLAPLAKKAQAGDRQAQLELGVRFEEGRGVKRDLIKACKLYARAASSSGGTIWVYSPPVGNGTIGRVIQVNAGEKHSGILRSSKQISDLKCQNRMYKNDF